ncbi:unnamed protein product [Haemonchus placei]|uniref:C3H1-type domain-containing protein n=1 Tax=Haemonchus placei TaxID=6290 RepID=A0A3P7VZ98_HAEPC|nr:unnamed protein product [Haemonchus placei]
MIARSSMASINMNPLVGVVTLPQHAPPPKNPKLYKTELCRSWMDHGRCNYGERCQYAHGEQEKRPIPRHPKYKTEACQSYHQSGYCPYGPRCHFIHSSFLIFVSVILVGSPMLQRLSSLPSYGSTGDSTAGSSSSADSGSESPNGSFSPGLDLDDGDLLDRLFYRSSGV